MPAPRGNKNALKLTTPELKKKAYQEYCNWIAQGKSPRSFTFEDADMSCTGETIQGYIKNDEVEFAPIHMKIAHAKAFAKWEQVVEDSATGVNQDANTASLQMLMRNKFGWDKKEDTSESIDNAAIEKLSAFFKLISATAAKDKE